MDLVASLLVGKPCNIFLVAALFLAGHLARVRLGIGSGRHPRSLLAVALVWAAYGAWEWLVVTRTPDADIRVDLLVIWPLVLASSFWFGIRAVR